MATSRNPLGKFARPCCECHASVIRVFSTRPSFKVTQKDLEVTLDWGGNSPFWSLWLNVWMEIPNVVSINSHPGENRIWTYWKLLKHSISFFFWGFFEMFTFYLLQDYLGPRVSDIHMANECPPSDPPQKQQPFPDRPGESLLWAVNHKSLPLVPYINFPSQSQEPNGSSATHLADGCFFDFRIRIMIEKTAFTFQWLLRPGKFRRPQRISVARTQTTTQPQSEQKKIGLICI